MMKNVLTALVCVALVFGLATVSSASHAVSINYDPGSGALTLSTAADLLSSFQMESASGGLGNTAIPAAGAGGPFNVNTADKLFFAVFGGSFGGDLSLGTLAAGQTEADLAGDLSFTGSYAAGGTVPATDFGIHAVGVVIPEPTSLFLLTFGLIGLVAYRRR